MVVFNTKCGNIKGNEREYSYEFLGVRFAKAERFKYATLVESFDGEYDATKPGDSCCQKRQFFPHLEHRERKFYNHEFRLNQVFTYSEDCLNLNIWTPKEKGCYPVVIYIHGGGFDSGANWETNIDGDQYAKRGVVMVAIQYRVGVFGYLTNEKLAKENGFDGNFGLDDQIKAIEWVRNNISDYYGDKNNITLMGQSAGAISIQYLVCSKKCEGLFKRAIMMSGGGCFPKFALPRECESTREYWNEVISYANCKDIDEFKTVDVKTIFEAMEIQRSKRKDNTYHNMPVIDHNIITGPIDKLIKNPHKIDYMIGFTNNDMYALLMALIGLKFSKNNNAYTYYFDLDAKGDKNKAFHSSDLRYVFGTLERSWRPYDEYDYKVSSMMIDYLTNFIKTGNPNSSSLPVWKIKKNKALRISNNRIKMARPNKFKLLHNTLFGGIK